jgi:hypothetical protein
MVQQLNGRKSSLRKATHAIEKGSLAPEDQFNGNLEIKHIFCSSAYRMYKLLTLDKQLYRNKPDTITSNNNLHAKDIKTDGSLQI